MPNSPRYMVFIVMSGIEIAGIALAVFPVVLNGLSHFLEGV